MDALLPNLRPGRLVPPIKTQGIKTRLLPFLLSNLSWNGRGVWVEPFLGSGVVLFNALPERARVADSNPWIIAFYRAVQDGAVNPDSVAIHLEREGARLAEVGEGHYYAIRDRFNSLRDPHDFLFLSRSCFNGVMRFNAKGAFNVPFCRKPERFARALRTKIVNQVRAVGAAMKGRDWRFEVADWRRTLTDLSADDFVYLDPPYIGRHADFHGRWTEDDAEELARRSRELPCSVALSMWRRNRFRDNEHLVRSWSHLDERTTEHFYHVGSDLSLRHAMVESLRATASALA